MLWVVVGVCGDVVDHYLKTEIKKTRNAAPTGGVCVAVVAVGRELVWVVVGGQWRLWVFWSAAGENRETKDRDRDRDQGFWERKREMKCLEGKF